MKHEIQEKYIGGIYYVLFIVKEEGGHINFEDSLSYVIQPIKNKFRVVAFTSYKFDYDKPNSISQSTIIIDKKTFKTQEQAIKHIHMQLIAEAI
jgi:hypothetical protein